MEQPNKKTAQANARALGVLRVAEPLVQRLLVARVDKDPRPGLILRSPHSRIRRPRVILLEPLIGKLWRREYLEVVDVANLLVGIDIDPNRCHWSLLSVRRLKL